MAFPKDRDFLVGEEADYPYLNGGGNLGLLPSGSSCTRHSHISLPMLQSQEPGLLSCL